MIKYAAVLCLFLSGVAGYTIEQFGQDLCIDEYISVGTVTYFREMNGVSAHDPSMLGMCGMLSLIFSVILILIKNQYFNSIITIILFISEFTFLNLMETASYQEIIYDSITTCSNDSVLGWGVFQVIFLILSIVYLYKDQEDLH